MHVKDGMKLCKRFLGLCSPFSHIVLLTYGSWACLYRSARNLTKAGYKYEKQKHVNKKGVHPYINKKTFITIALTRVCTRWIIKEHYKIMEEDSGPIQVDGISTVHHKFNN